MQRTLQLLQSTIGRKFLVAVTGICLVLFTIVHLAGNLQLLLPDGSHFNAYAEKLASLGLLLYIAEILLLLIAVAHIAAGIAVTLTSARARNQQYDSFRSKGGPSKYNASSRNMIIFGFLLLIFIVVHLLQFKFNLFAPYYMTELDGRRIRDLYKLVVVSFKNPLWVLFYSTMMLALGFHLRHGVWSALQSLGLLQSKNSPALYSASVVLAILLAVGFLLLPAFIYLDPLGYYAPVEKTKTNATEMTLDADASTWR